MNIVRSCRRNSRAIYLLTGFLAAAGLISYFRLPSNIYPHLSFPRIVILADSGDLSPHNMLLEVTRPLEQASRGVLGVIRVRSKTVRGETQISAFFQPNMDMRYALQLMQTQINQAQATLPPGTQVSVIRITPTSWAIMMMILRGNVPGADLRNDAYYILRPIFDSVPGVSQVGVEATDIQEVSVVVNPQKMLSHRLSLPEIAAALRRTNNVMTAGWLDRDYARYQVLASNEFKNLNDIRNTTVAIQDGSPVRLGEIAKVRYGIEDPTVLVYGNGKPGALITISRQLRGNILQIASQVKALANHLGSAIPQTLHLVTVYNLASFVSAAVKNIRDAVLIGGFLAILILFVFLREGRTTVIAATSLPLTVVCTFFFMYILGGTLNLMSLGGLAIAIGLVIDDAVVIIENIYRHLGLGESTEESAENGTRELLGAVIGSTATTIVVFSPLGLLTGVVGEFFRALCLTLVVAVALSLLFALTLIPLLSEQFLSPHQHHASAESFIQPALRVYERVVRWSLRRRWIVAAATALSVALTVFVYTHLKTGFLPRMDEGGFIMDTYSPQGTSLAETDRTAAKVEKIIGETPEVQSWLRRTGAQMGPFVTQQNHGELVVRLKPLSERHRSIFQVMDSLRRRILKSVPGVRIEFAQVLQDMIGDMEGSPRPIEVKIFGSNMPQLKQLADEIGPKIQKIPGIVDFRGLQGGNPQLAIHVDPVTAGRLGLTVNQVSQQVQAGLLGLTETELRETDRTVPIRVRFPNSFRYNYDDIRRYPIVTPAQQIVPLSSIAQIRQVKGESVLMRENERLMVTLTANIEHRGLGGAVRDVRRVLSTVHFPVGTSYEIGGLYRQQQQSFHDLLMVLFFALAAVFIVLVIQFRAFSPALIIMSAAPLSLLGVFTMLWITATPLNVSSFMGIILMVGLVVKNGIILFEYVHKLWEEDGLPLSEALVEAGKIRVRPILMTTLCTLFGLFPLALGIGAGAQLQEPLALAVIGGLSISTFITLLVMPVMYSLLHRATPEPILPADSSIRPATADQPS